MITTDPSKADAPTALVESMSIDRRGVLRVGTSFIAALAILTTSKVKDASACQDQGCCTLAFPCSPCATNGGCSGGWVCPPGYQDSWWTCSAGGRNCTCGECTPGGDCFSGYTGCSIALCF